jgi:hypothetical protein
MSTQEELEEMDYLLSVEAYDKWLYANYPIYNGDMLLSLYESGDVEAKYLREHGLPDNESIRGL